MKLKKGAVLIIIAVADLMDIVLLRDQLAKRHQFYNPFRLFRFSTAIADTTKTVMKAVITRRSAHQEKTCGWFML